MYRALIIKELRECAPLAVIAALVAAWALHVSTGGYFLPPLWDIVAQPTPYIENDPFPLTITPLLVSVLAIVLGLKQAVWEDWRGTYHYLLPRPVARSHVFLTKAVVGAAIVQLLGAAMLLIYAAWAATPGTHPSPFFWGMTLPGWKAWFVFPIVYFAALLSGLRHARWYGSRLLPLVGGAFVAFFLNVQPRMWLTLGGSLVASTLLAFCVAHAARTRDY
jgi:hypothetical protein